MKGILLKLFLIVLHFLVFSKFYNVRAEISGCTASISPDSVFVNTSNIFTVSILNNDEMQDIVYIRIVTPGDSLTISNVLGTNWSANNLGSSIRFSGGILSPLLSESFQFEVNSSNNPMSLATWQIQATDDTDGLNLVTCEGTHETEVISSSPTPTTEGSSTPSTTTTTVTNTVTVTAKDSTKPTIRLNTLSTALSKSVPTISGVAQDNGGVESVEYRVGERGNWNAVPITKSNTVNFSFIPQGVRDGRSTVSVRARDAAGNSVSDTVSFSLDRTGPNITITTALKQSYTTFPDIEGTAADPSGIQSVAYTLDGIEWTEIENFGAKFKISTATVDDGEYVFQVRAKDSVGNTSVSKPQPVFINRLPPRIGASVLSYRYQVLSPLADGMFHTVAQLTHTISVSVIGGPSAVNLFVNDRAIPLSRKKGTYLWEGQIVFVESGIHTLSLQASDKESTVEVDLPSVSVVSPGSINLTQANVSAYVFDEQTGEFVLWNAAAYGQVNPIVVTANSTAGVGFLLPPGTYYLDVRGQGVRGVTSAFTLPVMQPVTPEVVLLPGFRIGPFTFSLPFAKPQHLPLPTVKQGLLATPVSYPFPSVRLVTGQTTVSRLTLEGKQTVLALLNTWLPQTPVLLGQLAQFALEHPEQRVVVVFPHESSETVSLFQKRGAYTVAMVADPDGQLLESVPLTTSHLFIHINEAGNVTEYRLEL